MSGGNLQLQVEDDSPTCSGQTTPYSRAAAISSTEYLYGYFEFKAKFDQNKRIWPAFWFRPSDNTQYFEFDLLETCAYNQPTTGYYTSHLDELDDCVSQATASNNTVTGSYILNSGFNTYGLEWTPTHMKVYINGTMVHSSTNTDFHQPMHVIMSSNTILGTSSQGFCSNTGLPTSTSFPMKFEVDFFKVYQKHSESFYILGPDKVCLNQNTEFKHPYYFNYSTRTPNHSSGITEIGVEIFPSSLSHPEINPNCNVPNQGRHGRFTVKGTSIGTKTLSFTEAFDSGYSATMSKTVDVISASPINLYMSSSSYNGVLNNSTIGISSSGCTLTASADGATSFTWTKTGGSGTITFSGSGTTAFVSGLGSINLTITASTTCGVSTRTLVIYNYGGYYQMSPNPSQHLIFVEASEEKLFRFEDKDGGLITFSVNPRIESVTIYNDELRIIEFKDFNKTKRAEIDISRINPGKYIVEIRDEERIVRKKLLKIE